MRPHRQQAAHQAPPSLAFSRQEHWRGLPVPSPMHESEKWKWSCSVVSDSLRLPGPQPARLLRPWDVPGESTGVGCRSFLVQQFLKHGLQNTESPQEPLRGFSEIKCIFLMVLRCYLSFSPCWQLHWWCTHRSGWNCLPLSMSQSRHRAVLGVTVFFLPRTEKDLRGSI